MAPPLSEARSDSDPPPPNTQARSTGQTPVPDAADQPTFAQRLRRALVGSPRDLRDGRLFHSISLIPFLAWVGLGADGLSSSAYGPEEAFKTLGAHKYLAVALAVKMATTV